MLRYICCFTLLLASCVPDAQSPNYWITGQVDTLRAGSGLEYLGEKDHEERIQLTKGDVFSVRLDSVYVRESREIAGSEFLVYVEVFDVQPDDRQRLTRVLFKEVNQSAGFLINFRNRLAFGPIQYNGHPIRIRLFVVELDRQENEIASAIIREAIQIAGAFAPGLGIFAPTVSSAGDLILLLNQDDRELTADFTLYPATHSHGPHLETGKYVIIKTENPLRYKGIFRNGLHNRANYDTDQVRDEYGHLVAASPEDYTGLFRFFSADERNHPLYSDGNPITAWAALRALGDRLWLQWTILEHKDHGIVLDEAGTCRQPTNGEYKIRTYRYEGNDHQELSAVRGDRRDATYRLKKRVEYREKSYAILTVSRGGEPVERGLFEELSDADLKLLEASLQPDVTPQLIQQRVEALSSALVKLAESRRVVAEVNRTTGGDSQVRQTAQFPLAFLSRLVEPTTKENQLRNESILEIVRSMVTNFPYTLDAALKADVIATLQQLTDKHFTPNLRSNGKPTGTFTFVP